MARARWLGIAKGLASQPTAALLEHAPAAWIRAFVARSKGLQLSADRHGNLVVRYATPASRRKPPLVLMAHLDHPGFYVRAADGARAELEFRGGVRRPHARRGAAVEFFGPAGKGPIGRGLLQRVAAEAADANRLGGGVAKVTAGKAVAGGFAMWALAPFELRRSMIVGRALDDLLGAAAALATIDEIRRRRPRGAHVVALFTRAEEVGFYGALAAIEAGTVPKSAYVLSLETSRALAHAPQGGGVIVRVGDARSLFHPALMHGLHREARALAAEDGTFRFQRRLMDGGSCEATAFCSAGYKAGGVAVPLGNYHNMKGLDGGPRGIGAESVHVNDYISEVKLLVRLAEKSGELAALERGADEWFAPALARATKALAEAPRLR